MAAAARGEDAGISPGFVLQFINGVLRAPTVPALAGAATVLERVATPARVSSAAAPALTLERARLDDAAGRAMSADDLVYTEALLAAAAVVLSVVGGSTVRAPTMGAAVPAALTAGPGVTHDAVGVTILLLSRAAAAAEAGGGGLDAGQLLALFRRADYCLFLLTQTLGAADASWRRWAVARGAVAAVAAIRWAPRGAEPGRAAQLCLSLGATLICAAYNLGAATAADMAPAMGAIVAALGAALSALLGEPRLEALTRRAGAARAGARVEVCASGVMLLEAGGPAPPAGWEPRSVAVGLAAVLDALPAAQRLAEALRRPAARTTRVMRRCWPRLRWQS
jgi:hypothetical protein